MGPLSVTQEDNFVILWVQKLQLSHISSYTAEITRYFHIDGSVHDCCISNTNPLETSQNYTEPPIWLLENCKQLNTICRIILMTLDILQKQLHGFHLLILVVVFCSIQLPHYNEAQIYHTSHLMKMMMIAWAVPTAEGEATRMGAE